MSRYAVSRAPFGPYETVVLSDTQTGGRAVIAAFGATLLRLDVAASAGLVDITDGYATPDELTAQTGGRAWIMAPFSNRIDDGQYAWLGRRHDLGVEDPLNRVILHGLLKTVVYDVAAESADDASARAVFRTQALRPGAYPGYPFAVDVSVAYTFEAGRLTVEVAAANVGEQDAPFCCGWHPYFKTRPAGGIDDLTLAVPARTFIVADRRLLPLAGEAAYKPVEQAGPYDFRPAPDGAAKALGTQFIDASYADLQADADGVVRTRLTDPTNGMEITVFQRRGLMHVYTGDTLPMRQRHSIALEPVEVMTNAFNRPECRDAVTLKAGATRSYWFGVEAAQR